MLREVYGSRTGMACRKFLQVLLTDLDDDNVPGLSAQMSYYFVLSMFPCLILVAAMVSMLTYTQEWNKILAWFILYLPAQSRHLMLATIASVTTAAQSRFLTIGLVGTIWAATGGIMNLTGALNVIYNAKETRSYFRRIALSCLILAILMGIFLVLFALLAIGDVADAKLAIFLHAKHSLLWLWHIGRWVLSFVLTVLAVAIIDNVLPNHRRSWRWVTTGSCFTVAAWLAANAGFNFYVAHFGAYQKTYGVLGDFVVLMIWIYIMGVLVLTGAEINWVVENWKTRIRGSSATEGNG